MVKAPSVTIACGWATEYIITFHPKSAGIHMETNIYFYKFFVFFHAYIPKRGLRVTGGNWWLVVLVKDPKEDGRIAHLIT